MHFC